MLQDIGPLGALANIWNTPLSGAQGANILEFCEKLLLWNRSINLTGASSVEQLIADHLPDSFALSAAIPAGARVVDVGSGGGLPALPFALLRPDCSLSLVEPRAKRSAFLRAAARELALPNVKILGGRAENLPPGTFDVAASRATFPPQEWLKLGSPLVVPGGLVLLFLGGDLASPSLEKPLTRRISYSAGGKDRQLLVHTVPRGT